MKIFYKYLPLLSVLLVFISLYFNLLYKYFEQDEWHNFGIQIYNTSSLNTVELLTSIFLHSLPITQLYNFINFSLFGVNNTFPAITVIVLILVNSFFWYKNVATISRNNIVALGAILFAYLSPIAIQSITWVIPAVASQLALLFLNLSFFFYIKYLNNEKLKSLLLVGIFTLLAIFSKQNSIFLILFYPFLYLYYKGFTRERIIRAIKFFIFPAILFVGLYLFKIGGIRLGESRFVSGIIDIFNNSLLLPSKSLTQLLFPYPKYFYELPANKYIIKIFSMLTFIEPQDITLVVQLLIALVFGSFGILLFLISKDKHLKRSIVVFSIFFITSFLPFTLDKFSTGNLYMESRYYQLGAFGLGTVVSILIILLVNIFSKNKFTQRIIILLIVFFSSLYLTNSYLDVKDQLSKQIEVTQKREEILEFIKQKVPQSSKNVILYTENVNHGSSSNITGEYFQTGLLYPFLVYSYPSDYSNPNYFEDDTLWDYTLQGVYEKDGYLTGIFYDFNKLNEYMRKNPGHISSLYSFQFDYQNIKNNTNADGNFYDLRFVEFRDVSNEIRDKVKK